MATKINLWQNAKKACGYFDHIYYLDHKPCLIISLFSRHK